MYFAIGETKQHGRPRHASNTLWTPLQFHIYHPHDCMTQCLLFYPTTLSTPRPRARHVFRACLLLICWSFGMPCGRVVVWCSGATAHPPQLELRCRSRERDFTLIGSKQFSNFARLYWKLYKLSPCASPSPCPLFGLCHSPPSCFLI